jgi:hypothetical protein
VNASSTVRICLQSLAFLVAYRGNILRLHIEFSSVLTQLSNWCDDPNDWLGPEISPKERIQLLGALQGTGVFGMRRVAPFEVLAFVETQPDDREAKSLKWFFSPSEGSTVRTCEPYMRLLKESAHNIFSQYSANNCSVTSELSRVGKYRSASKCQMPMLDFCNDDLVGHFFSFLGYKRLLRMRLVCKNWKDIADNDYEFWKPLYKSRYGIEQNDLLLHDGQRALPWKQIFVDRWTAERAIRYKRDKNGWKIRLCRRIGCLTVLTTPIRVKHHEATHNTANRRRQVKFTPSSQTC